MEIEFICKQNEAATMWSFTFAKPPGLRFDAGDYVELALTYGDNRVGGRRWYTISSAPQEPHLIFTTIIPDTPSEFKAELMKLTQTDTATISPPIGTFNLPRDTDRKMLWIAGGIGVTPFRSMARSLQLDNDKRSINMLYIAKPGTFIYQTELRAVCSEFDTSSSQLGFESILNLHNDWDQRDIYLSGPQQFCEDLYYNFTSRGARRNQLNLDYFPGYSQI